VQHALAVLLSPQFRSFSQFENSAVGYGRLHKGLEPFDINQRIQDINTLLDKSRAAALLSPADSTFMNKTQARELIVELREAAGKGDSVARDIIAKSKLLPSEYAEVKMLERLPINKETVSAIFTPSHPLYPQDLDSLMAAGKKAGIPTGSPKELLPKDKEDLYSALAENITRIASRTGWFPDSPYMRGLSGVSATHLESGELMDIIQGAITTSPKFESDVASFLTYVPKSPSP
jgi:hypothetical protein